MGLIKVQTDREVTTIKYSGTWKDEFLGGNNSVKDIHIFKSAQRVLLGQLLEPELDRLSASLVVVGDNPIASTRSTQLAASQEFWERLIELQPIIDKFKRSWKKKYGSHIWVDKKYQDKVIILTPIQQPVVEKETTETVAQTVVDAETTETVTEYEPKPVYVPYLGYFFVKNDDKSYTIFDKDDQVIEQPKKITSLVGVKKFIRNELPKV